jgi:hypothetical protein
MFVYKGRPLPLDTPLNLDGLLLPANWLRLSSPEDKAAVGIAEVADPPAPPDQRFYWGWDDQGQAIPKDHAQLVEQWSQQTRTTANTLLQPTDWTIIREADNGKAADPVLKQWREDIRLAAGEKIAAIQATVDTPALAEYVTSSSYSTWPNDPYSPFPLDSAGDNRDFSVVDGSPAGTADADLV